MSQSKPNFAMVAIFITFLFIQGCAAAKIPQATKNNSAALGITIDFSVLPDHYETFDVVQVYFIKLANKEDALTKDIIYKSNCISSFNLPVTATYFLDIEPGFYAAVGAIGRWSYNHADRKYEKYWAKFDSLIYFPEQMVKKTITEVKSNTMTYMGNFVLSDVSLLEKMHNSDELQIYYYNNEIFDKEHQYHKVNETSGSVSAKFFSPTMVGFDKSIDKEIEFLTRIKMTFISTDWANSINHRLEMLNK